MRGQGQHGGHADICCKIYTWVDEQLSKDVSEGIIAAKNLPVFSCQTSFLRFCSLRVFYESQTKGQQSGNNSKGKQSGQQKTQQRGGRQTGGMRTCMAVIFSNDNMGQRLHAPSCQALLCPKMGGFRTFQLVDGGVDVHGYPYPWDGTSEERRAVIETALMEADHFRRGHKPVRVAQIKPVIYENRQLEIRFMDKR